MIKNKFLLAKNKLCAFFNQQHVALKHWFLFFKRNFLKKINHQNSSLTIEQKRLLSTKRLTIFCYLLAVPFFIISGLLGVYGLGGYTFNVSQPNELSGKNFSFLSVWGLDASSPGSQGDLPFKKISPESAIPGHNVRFEINTPISTFWKMRFVLSIFTVLFATAAVGSVLTGFFVMLSYLKISQKKTKKSYHPGHLVYAKSKT